MKGRCIAIFALALSGCSDSDPGLDRGGSAPQPFALAHQSAKFTPNAEGGQFAYTHEIAIAEQARWVSARFVALKKLCLEEAALHCVLLDANSSLSDGGPVRPSAHIQARLPHDGVERFMQAAAAPVVGEVQSDVTVLRSGTRMEDLGRPIADTTRRLEQLDDYRKRLDALERRPDTRAEDLIKIAGELSQVQSRIEESTEQRRKLDERVQTELVAVYIQAEAPSGGPLAPIEAVWRDGANILGRSAAGALRFALIAVPWSPIVAVAVGALRLLVRAWRRRQQG